MVRYWALIEADFQREYQLDLMPVLRAGMSWRRFSALLTGLSPESMWRRVATAEPVELSSEQAESFIGTL